MFSVFISANGTIISLDESKTCQTTRLRLCWLVSCCVSCHSHHGAGVGALLRLTLPDEEGPVTLAPQHLLGLRALDVSHVPGALVVVRRALVLLQRVGAVKERHTPFSPDHRWKLQ